MTTLDDSISDKATGAWRRAPLLLGVFLVVAWLLWSGYFTKPLLLALGAFSCALTVYIIKRMGYFDSQVFALGYGLRLIVYWIWLFGEILKSSIEVARIVLAPRLHLNPQMVEINVDDLDPVDQVLLGNSITLTPGTITLDVYEDRLLAHALTEEGAEALRQGEMKRRVLALRGTVRTGG